LRTDLPPSSPDLSHTSRALRRLVPHPRARRATSRFGAALRAALRAALATALLAAMAACSTSPVQQSRTLWEEGRFEDAVLLLQGASSKDPDDRSLMAAYHRRRDLALSQLSVAADSALSAHRLDEAQDLYQRCLRLDPNGDRARDGIERVALARRMDGYLAEATQSMQEGRNSAAEGRLRQILAAQPQNHAARRLLEQLRERDQEAAQASRSLKSALATPVSLEFRETPLRNVFEVLSRTAGLNFVFDRDVRTDAKITIFIRNNPIEDLLRVLLSTNALERKVLNENTVLIYPNTPAKLKEYQELVVRTFYLVNADAKQVETMLKTLAHVRDTYIDEKINMVVVRDTPDAVRLAERMIESIDIAEAEVMLELEVVELSRTRAQNLGIQLPSSITRGSSAPIGASGSGAGTAAAAAGSIATSNFSSLITTIPNPLLVANLYAQDNDSNLLANPRIRVKNREKAKVLIGEKLPVITSTAVQNAGVASSVSYIDVGLKLEVEPQVYLDDEVGIKVLLEVNSNLGSITVGNSTTGETTAYQVGTRSAQTTLRLHDGETQVLAGLINDNESASWNKVPGLGDIPGIGRLFSNDNSTHEKTEIVLLVTPRIVRNLATADGDRLLVPAGTDAVVGAPPLTIGPTAPRSLSLQGGAVGSGKAPMPSARRDETAAPPAEAPAAPAAPAAPVGAPPPSAAVPPPESQPFPPARTASELGPGAVPAAVANPAADKK
jgi:general secretion pathway protein D